MGYLLFYILFSSIFILVFRWRQKRSEDLITLAAINYLAGAGLALLSVSEDVLASTLEPAFLLGLVNGAFFFIAFIFLMPLLASKGAALSSAVSRLSILVPISCGIIVWSERPTVLQYAGILSACLSLVLIGNKGIYQRVAESRLRGFVLVSLFFVTAGITRLSQEAFRQYCRPEEASLYVLTTFLVAGVVSILVLIIRRRRPTVNEFFFGCVVGVANNLQVYFILKALGVFPGFVVFPVTSVGGLLFTAGVAVAFLKERLNRFGLYGIGFAILALLLLNVEG